MRTPKNPATQHARAMEAELLAAHSECLRNAERDVAALAATHRIIGNTRVYADHNFSRGTLRVVVEGRISPHHALAHAVIGPLLQKHAPIIALIHRHSPDSNGILWVFRGYQDSRMQFRNAPTAPKDGTLIRDRTLGRLPRFGRGSPFAWERQYIGTWSLLPHGRRGGTLPAKQHALGAAISKRIGLECAQLQKHVTPEVRRILKPIASDMHTHAKAAFDTSSVFAQLREQGKIPASVGITYPIEPK
jgi:hypothetical protein